MPRITACSTLTFALSSLQTDLEHIARYGFDRVEIADMLTHTKHFSTHSSRTVDPVAVRELLKRNGLTAIAANCVLATIYQEGLGYEKVAAPRQSAAEREDVRKAKENVVFLGPTGTGKSHLAVSLGLAACLQGHRVRFATAAGLINDPELIILDEPTTGLDPQARRNIWALIREIHQRGVTVVLTTHYMEEAEDLCDRLAIMDRGCLLAVDTPRNLISRLKAAYTVKLALDHPLTEGQMASLNGTVEFVQELDGNAYLLRLKGGPSSLGKVLDEMVRSDINLERLEIAPVTLEDIFLELTGNELQD